MRLKRRKKKLTSIQSEDIPERIAGTKASSTSYQALSTGDTTDQQNQTGQAQLRGS